ncbi:MAG: hypothetical protein ACOVSW_18680 [Candidatus Kapaibacteriota bacterium]
MPYAEMSESGAVVRRSAIGKRKESKVVIENNQPSPQANNELTKEKMPVKRKNIPKTVDCFGSSNTLFIEEVTLGGGYKNTQIINGNLFFADHKAKSILDNIKILRTYNEN